MFVRAQGFRGSTPPDKLTNEQFCQLLYYVVRKEELESLDRGTCTVRKYLINPSKYVEMRADLEEGSSQPGDNWDKLASYLKLTEEEKGVMRIPEVVRGEEGVDVLVRPEEREEEEEQEPMEVEVKDVASLSWQEEEEAKLARLRQELPHLAAAGLLARGLGEVARMVREDSFHPSILTNGLVEDLQSTQVGKYKY